MLAAALDTVRRLRRAGARIDVQDGKLLVTAAPGVLTDTVKAELVAHKHEILALLDEAVHILNERGVRIIPREGGSAVAIWRDADGRELRDALDAVGHGEADIVYLDAPEAGVPSRYDNFVPDYVQQIWAARGLAATGPQRVRAAFRAFRLNRFFDSYGSSPGRSGITTDTELRGILWRQAAARE